MNQEPDAIDLIGICRGEARFEMWLVDWESNRLRFAYVYSVDEARALWVRFAGLTAGMNLCQFEVIDSDGKKRYEGSYVTDEC